MLISDFSKYLEKLEKQSSRLQITAILSEMFRKSSSKNIDKICYLSLGRLAPKYTGIEFAMAEKMMVRAIANTFAISPQTVQKKYKDSGDLGEVAYKLKVQRPATKNKKPVITIISVYNQLLEIANESGQGSVERKINSMARFLKELDPVSVKFITRIPLNKLRLGFSDMTVLDALSWSKTGNKSLRKPLENAYSVLADIGKIAQIFRVQGIKGISKIKSEVGIPILPAQAERLKTAKEILEKLSGKCALEGKYDGLRMQLHLDKNKNFSLEEKNNPNLFETEKQFFVKIFSRNLEEMTHMFPDVVQAAQKLCVSSVILDGEAIAFNPKTGKFLPFQETIQRKRKHGVAQKAKELPLKLFCFDILNLNGKPLLNLSFSKRRELLERILGKSKGEESGIILTEQKIVSKPESFNKYFNEVVSEGLEGLMAKKLDAVYQAGARNFNWVKFKAGMNKDLADTIDCVVLGYYRGKGKRAAFGIGAFLVGIPDKEKFLTVSKIGTGLTDEQWREIYKRCEKLKIKEKPQEYIVDKNLNPDIWCRPQLVVEIEADTITKSPIHTAGLALRFPRLKRFRDDKTFQQATSLKELKTMKK